MSRPIANVSLLIRRPVSDVFNAFVDPSLITLFWLQKTSGALAEGATLEWEFLIPGAVETVTVQDFKVDKRIAFTWSDGIEVVMTFAAHSGTTATRLAIEASGFKPDDLEAVVGATEGFAIVLCDLKTLLETGRSANLVKDKAELIRGA